MCPETVFKFAGKLSRRGNVLITKNIFGEKCWDDSIKISDNALYKSKYCPVDAN